MKNITVYSNYTRSKKPVQSRVASLRSSVEPAVSYKATVVPSGWMFNVKSIGTKRVTGELWLLGTLFGFMGHIQQPVTLKNGKSAYKWMHYCSRWKNKQTKKNPSAHKSIILIGITSPQLAGAPAGLGSSSDKWKAAVWIQRRLVISQNIRTTTAFCSYRPCN